MRTRLPLLLLLLAVGGVALMGGAMIWLRRTKDRPPADPKFRYVEGETAHGELTVEGGLACLRLRGSPSERGRAHGELLAPVIRATLERLRPEEAGLREFAVRTCGERLIPFLPRDLRMELEGIAAGSGLTLFQVVFLNARFELAAFGMAGPAGRPPGFLGAAAVEAGPHVVRMIVADDLDGRMDELLVVIHEAEEGDALFGITLPGMAGILAGVRGEGGATLRPVRVSSSPVLHGLPWPLLLRLLLEQSPDVEQGVSLPAQATLHASVPWARSLDSVGTLQVAPSGATWFRSSGRVAMATEELVTASRGATDRGERDEASRKRLDESARQVLGESRLPDPGCRLRLMREGDAVSVEIYFAGERRTRVLGSPG